MRPGTGESAADGTCCARRAFRVERRGLLGTLALALAVVVASAETCAASGLVIQAPDLTAAPGSSGSFDLLLLNVPGSGSFTVSADQFTLSLSGPLGIHFTDVSIATDPVAAPYIFVSSGTTQSGGPPLSFDSFPNTTRATARTDARASSAVAW